MNEYPGSLLNRWMNSHSKQKFCCILDSICFLSLPFFFIFLFYLFIYFFLLLFFVIRQVVHQGADRTLGAMQHRAHLQLLSEPL